MDNLKTVNAANGKFHVNRYLTGPYGLQERMSLDIEAIPTCYCCCSGLHFLIIQRAAVLGISVRKDFSSILKYERHKKYKFPSLT